MPKPFYEVAVVGSGPGGALTSALLAEGGKNVVLIEEGPRLEVDSCPPFSPLEMAQKYRSGGLTPMFGPTKIAYVEARVVGGGSEVNSGLYHRTGEETLGRWKKEFQLEGASPGELAPLFSANEQDLSVGTMPGAPFPASLKLREGAERLGWESSEIPRWYQYPTPNPASGVRQSMSRTFVPRALAAGCTLLPATRIRKIHKRQSRWILEGPGTEIHAGTVFLCCGAIQTPHLLRRSGFRRNVGSSLSVHPMLKLVARFPTDVNHAGMGVGVHQVTKFSPAVTFGCSVSGPGYLALGLLDHPGTLAELPAAWRRMAAYYLAISPRGLGTVRRVPGFESPLVSYHLTPEDYELLATGLRHLSLLMLEAGAEAVFPGVGGLAPLRSRADVDNIPKRLGRNTNLTTVHLTSTCPAGENRKRCPVDSWGKVNGTDALFVNDASLLCDAPSVNPQGTIMAFARRNALKFLGRL